MSLNSLIINTLKPLNVPIEFNTYDLSDDTYIVFMEYNQGSGLNADDDEFATHHFFQADIFSTGNYLKLAKDVKKLLKEVGFTRINEFDGDYEPNMKRFRKTMRFCYSTIREEF